MSRTSSGLTLTLSYSLLTELLGGQMVSKAAWLLLTVYSTFLIMCCINSCKCLRIMWFGVYDL